MTSYNHLREWLVFGDTQYANTTHQSASHFGTSCSQPRLPTFEVNYVQSYV